MHKTWKPRSKRSLRRYKFNIARDKALLISRTVSARTPPQKRPRKRPVPEDCYISQNDFFRFVTWIHPDQFTGLILKKSRNDKEEDDDDEDQKFTLNCESFLEVDAPGPSEKSLRKMELARFAWLKAHGWDQTHTWFCRYIQRNIGMPADTKVVSYLGNGINSVVLGVDVGSPATRQALKVTRAGTFQSPMETKVHKLLASKGLAPRLFREVRLARKFTLQYLEAITVTAGQALAKKAKGSSKEHALRWSAQISHLLVQMEAMGVTHGDLHLDNIGVTPKRRLVLIDFDRSSTKNFSRGFDLAVVLDALQPKRMHRDSRCVNTTLLKTICQELLPKLPKAWHANSKGYPDLAKLRLFQSAWVRVLDEKEPADKLKIILSG
jgi:predicted Ser/Thr protein kinase